MLEAPENFPLALTFDDVLLLPGESGVLPTDCETITQFTLKIRLSIPVVSAAMDTVTENETAIAMAQAGGLGIIHRNGSVEEQAAEILKVKKSEGGMVIHPVTIAPEQPLSEALRIQKEVGISSFCVVKNGKLVGLLSHRDFQFEEDLNQPVKNCMTPADKLVTAREGISQDEAKQLLHKHRIEKLPVVDDKFNLKGLITVKDLEKSRRYPHATKDDLGRLRVGGSIGTGSREIERAGALLEAGADCVVIDTAHGHTKSVLETLAACVKNYPKAEFVAGNIATEEGATALIKAGASAVKVGMGPGSICTTRIVAGVGVPQLTAILSAVKAAKAAGIPVIADGGIKFSGDIVKALAAGASTVMIGSLFAGTDESPGETVLYQGRSYKVYRGMGSLSAMQRGGRDRYFQGKVPLNKLVPEGIEGRVPHRGKIADVIHQLIGGLRAGMGYVGAANLNELRNKGKFVRISSAGWKESHAHDVIITQEAPNYRVE
ncbi:MAG: IMP dehydrogenase [Deltaproteobacteria bacterium]|nr:IMP dehydrogenase [Deltaproteobacteria bacterium]